MNPPEEKILYLDISKSRNDLNWTLSGIFQKLYIRQ